MAINYKRLHAAQTRDEQRWVELQFARGRIYDEHRQAQADLAEATTDNLQRIVLYQRGKVAAARPQNMSALVEEQVVRNLRGAVDDWNTGLATDDAELRNVGRIEHLRMQQREELRRKQRAKEEADEEARCREAGRRALLEELEAKTAKEAKDRDLTDKASLEAEAARFAAMEATYTRVLERNAYEDLMTEERERAAGRTARALDRVVTHAELEERAKGRQLQEAEEDRRIERAKRHAREVRESLDADRAMLFGQIEWEKAMDMRMRDLDANEALLTKRHAELDALRSAELAALAKERAVLNDVHGHLLDVKKAFADLHPALTRLARRHRMDLDGCAEWGQFVDVIKHLP